MKKLIIACLTFLICGVRLTDSSAMTAGLFIHYLLGSGESVTLHSPELLKLCEREGIVNAYKTEYVFAVGRFSCRHDGTAWDLYDFSYANDDSWGNLQECVSNHAYVLIDFSGVYARFSTVNLGRCLVREGYGKPFHVEIKP